MQRPIGGSSEGLVHRDFKPDNALIGDDGRLRVIDFGLAHERDQTARRPAAGTPRYMAPEQVRGDPLSAAADQFAVGASLAEALTAVCRGEPPAWLAATCARSTAPLPQDRFADLDALDAALARDPRAIWIRRGVAGGVLALVGSAFVIGVTAFSSRELRNHLERCATFGERLSPACNAALEGPGADYTSLCFAEAKRRAHDDFERRYLSALLAQTDRVAEAAAQAQIDRTHFYRLLRRHNLGHR